MRATAAAHRADTTGSLRHGRTTRRAIDVSRMARMAYAVLLLAAVIGLIASLLVRPERPLPDAWSAVTVGQSASLWAVARSHPVDGLSTADTVDLIREANSLPGTVIMPGQTIRVPANTDTVVAVASR